MKAHYSSPVLTQYRFCGFWVTFERGKWLPVVWLCLGGSKPLAHLPRWKRLLRPSIRWRLL